MCDLNQDFTPKRLENFSVKAGAAIFTHVARIAHLCFSCACKHWSKKKKTGSSNLLFARAKIWSHVILIATILVRQPYAPQLWICGLKIMNLKDTVGRKSLLLSQPSMCYQYFQKLRSSSKVVSPRWPPLISWLERWSNGSSIQSILNINACSISLVVLTSHCLLRFCVIAYALSYP